ncbi:MAG: transposase [Luteibaculaceae bacterium]
MLFIHPNCLGKCTDISFIVPTILRVCHNKRIKRNKVFCVVVTTGKSIICWFFSFKLHLISSDKGEILSFYLNKGNVDDRDLSAITRMTREIFGKLFGDNGYIFKALSNILFVEGIQSIMQVRRIR